MLFLLTTILAAILLAAVMVQVTPVASLIRRFRRPSADRLGDDQCPPVAVLLSLRGGDPFLVDCLRGLVQQDYPDYELFVALDHPQDPASEYIDRVIDDLSPTNLTKVIVTDRPSRCTLVNHNYAHVLEGLDSRFRIVVFVDADAVTWPVWLRTLVRPLVRDPSLGGTSGNRWYAPQRPSFGALTRAAWNMGSVVQSDRLRLPWGGSMALPADVARHPTMLERWRTSFSGDAVVYSWIRQCGKQFQFNPDVMLLNREDTALRPFYHWMSRQLLQCRLYHPVWSAVLAQAVGTSVVLVAGILLAVWNLTRADWLGVGLLVGPLLAYWIAYFVLLVRMNAAIAGIAAARGAPGHWLTRWAACKLFWVVPLVQLVFIAGALRALRIRHVCWRGIDYRIRGSFDIELVEYQPYAQNTASENHSL